MPGQITGMLHSAICLPLFFNQSGYTLAKSFQQIPTESAQVNCFQLKVQSKITFTITHLWIMIALLVFDYVLASGNKLCMLSKVFPFSGCHT